ncbi:MAG: nitroreductase family protein [Methylotenera sp.]|jgi:nitroreductase|uniref:nitroreductase family protein n=1 Tax=Methylotenera sp. TaxID=2051956 RepID=UPI0027168F2F|nr:nitroreductase family protein [Methylotenera sp.]MDO9151906.1 nitroreductase family protein [Methylotenera sp.]
MSLLEIEMSLYEAILARRSVRSYTTQKLEKGAVSSLLEAAIRAPTAMHGEPWAFVIIQDQQLLKKISDQAKPMLLTMMHHNQHQHALKLFELPIDQDFNIFYDAGTLILICGNTKIKFFGGDCWLAAENLILAACAMGLGSCIIGSALPVLNLPEVKTKLGIPNEFTVVAPIVVGYPDDMPPPSSRKHPRILSNITTGSVN